jgi:hypothetical protein
MSLFIIAADRKIDSIGSHQETEGLLSQAIKKNLKITNLEIVNLSKRWENKLNSHQFKSGASAMAAINEVRKIIQAKKTDLVVIKGEDLLKTGYPPGERENFMKLYNNKFTPLDGYNELVPMFLKKFKISEKTYFSLRDDLFKNYTLTWKKNNTNAIMPHEKWFQPLTKYFRGVDCANPNIDFSAQMILASKKTADLLKIPLKSRIEILGNSFVKIKVDGFESLPKIAPYLHLKRAIAKALVQAKINFKNKFNKGEAFLEAYTCYPVVPLALILKLGLVSSADEIHTFLNNHEITVTGGLNLARAPWSLTSLNSIIVMRERLRSTSTKKYGLVHGNGSLGNQQGITILKKV